MNDISHNNAKVRNKYQARLIMTTAPKFTDILKNLMIV